MIGPTPLPIHGNYGVETSTNKYICRTPRGLAPRRTAKYSQVPAAGLIDKPEIRSRIGDTDVYDSDQVGLNFPLGWCAIGCVPVISPLDLPFKRSAYLHRC